MRRWLRLPTLAMLTICCGLTTVGSAAEVSIIRDNNQYQIRGTGYEATVAHDGCLTNLRINGLEFLKSSPSFPRGAYLYQKGLLPLPTVEQQGDNIINAKCDKATARYEYAASSLKWVVTNTSAEPLLMLMVFDPAVKAVVSDKGDWEKPPGQWGWKVSTWFREKSKVRISGSTRLWGPWAEGLQVWEATVAPNETHTVEMEMGPAAEAESKKAAEVAAYTPEPPTDPVGPMWNMKSLSNPPKVYPAEGFQGEGVKALFYEGRPFRGKPTRVFAWLGLPKVEPGKKVPGIVLVHGGGGTAFDSWVRLWTERGYAAIAMDTCGCVPNGAFGNWERHEFGGPPGWGGYNQIDWPREDQWTYHAVAAAILAHSLLRAQPEVETDRVGLTGISWGGYLTGIIAGVDHRFKFAVPVYGCGFTTEHAFADSVLGLGKERADRWMRWWDPSVYLKDAPMPMLWVTGTNDFAYTFNALQKSYRLPKGSRTLCVRVRMPHGHGPAGEGPKEIQAFADSILKGGDPLPKISSQGCDGSQAWATFTSKVPIAKAELTFTKDLGKWQDRKWETIPAQLAENKVTATLPEGVTVYYLNLFDQRDCVVSTEHVEIAPPGQGQ